MEEEMIDLGGGAPRFWQFMQEEANKRYPPKYIAPAWAPGEDYFSMVAKHGVPHGPFDKERQLPYRGK